MRHDDHKYESQGDEAKDGVRVQGRLGQAWMVKGGGPWQPRAGRPSRPRRRYCELADAALGRPTPRASAPGGSGCSKHLRVPGPLGVSLLSSDETSVAHALECRGVAPEHALAGDCAMRLVCARHLFTASVRAGSLACVSTR